MSAVHEVAIGLEWILATLRADSQWLDLSPGGVHIGSAPPSTEYPLTIINFQSGIDVVTANARRIMVNALYLIKAVGPALSSSATINLASRIDELFDKKRGAATGGVILACFRENPINYYENIAGTKYMHLGGLYHIKTQQVPS